MVGQDVVVAQRTSEFRRAVRVPSVRLSVATVIFSGEQRIPRNMKLSTDMSEKSKDRLRDTAL